eukprot:760467-Hanusia_phi.AAC.13
MADLEVVGERDFHLFHPRSEERERDVELYPLRRLLPVLLCRPVHQRVVDEGFQEREQSLLVPPQDPQDFFARNSERPLYACEAHSRLQGVGHAERDELGDLGGGEVSREGEGGSQR